MKTTDSNITKLIVDDNDLNVQVLAEFLNYCRYCVQIASDAGKR